MDVCINYSSYCDKILSRNLKKANGLRRNRPSWQVWCGWAHGEMRRMLNLLSSLFPFVQFGITFKTAFPPQVNLQTRGVCLLAALNPIKLTTKVCKFPSGSGASCVHRAYVCEV